MMKLLMEEYRKRIALLENDIETIYKNHFKIVPIIKFKRKILKSHLDQLVKEVLRPIHTMQNVYINCGARTDRPEILPLVWFFRQSIQTFRSIKS